nr:cysteine-rich receptor-like protein kinase [Tanacetum cinerariifolium]
NKAYLQEKARGQTSRREARDFGSDKAPGPDGLTFNFMKNHWATLKDDIISNVMEFENSAYIPQGCNSMSIQSNRKILAKWLSQVISSVVGEVQMAYIKGRQIFDGHIIADEVITWAKKYKKKLMFLKVDFEKDFDTLNLSFLMSIMEQMGFSNKWRKWILSCLKSAYTLVLINGSSTSEFKVERGLRQGEQSLLNAKNLSRILNSFHLASGLKEDYWVGDSPLKCSFPRLFGLETIKGCLVSDRTPSSIAYPTNVQLDNTMPPHWSVTTIPGLTFHWSWRRPIRSGPELDELTDLMNLLAYLWLSDAPDSWSCLIDSFRVFTVRGMRHHIFKSSNSFVQNQIRWNKLLHAKINICSWRITNKRLPTLINLDKRAIDLNSVRCQIYDKALRRKITYSSFVA